MGRFKNKLISSLYQIIQKFLKGRNQSELKQRTKWYLQEETAPKAGLLLEEEAYQSECEVQMWIAEECLK